MWRRVSERDQECVQDGNSSEEVCDELPHHQGKIQAALGACMWYMSVHG